MMTDCAHTNCAIRMHILLMLIAATHALGPSGGGGSLGCASIFFSVGVHAGTYGLENFNAMCDSESPDDNMTWFAMLARGATRAADLFFAPDVCFVTTSNESLGSLFTPSGAIVTPIPILITTSGGSQPTFATTVFTGVLLNGDVSATCNDWTLSASTANAGSAALATDWLANDEFMSGQPAMVGCAGSYPIYCARDSAQGTAAMANATVVPSAAPTSLNATTSPSPPSPMASPVPPSPSPSSALLPPPPPPPPSPSPPLFSPPRSDDTSQAVVARAGDSLMLLFVIILIVIVLIVFVLAVALLLKRRLGRHQRRRINTPSSSFYASDSTSPTLIIADTCNGASRRHSLAQQRSRGASRRASTALTNAMASGARIYQLMPTMGGNSQAASSSTSAASQSAAKSSDIVAHYAYGHLEGGEGGYENMPVSMYDQHHSREYARGPVPSTAELDRVDDYGIVPDES